MENLVVVLSKVLDLALAPLSWALVLLAAAALGLRRPRRAAACAAAALLVLLVFSSGKTAAALQRYVEAPARDTSRPGVVYDAVVVLSGEVDDDASERSGATELTAAADRVVGGFEVLRAGTARTVFLVGGSPDPRPGRPAEPERVAGLLRAWGVAPDRIVVETESRNTHENAVATARVAAAQGWKALLVVTSAAHVPRALGCLRHEGLAPDVRPVDHRAASSADASWLPRAAQLARSTEALRELAGRLMYRLLGYM